MMAKKDEGQPDPKEVEKQLKEAKGIAKDLARSTKAIAEAKSVVKQLNG
jgi:hypothetical protein